MLQERPTGQGNRMSGIYESNVPEGFGFQGEGEGQWSGDGDAWQSTLFRLFGSAEVPLEGNGLG